MKIKSTFVKLTSLALLVATLTIYTASRAGAAGIKAAPRAAATAQTEITPATEFEFGLIGLMRSQSARISAVLAIDPNVRPQPIEVEFSFHDREGNLVASERQSLLPEHAGSFEIRGIIDPNYRGGDVTPCIKVAVGPELRDRIVCTLEVRDANGKTSFALNNPRMIIDPNN